MLRRLRKWHRRLLVVLGIIFSLLVADYWAYPYGTELSGRSHNKGENGLWLRYTWYFGERSEMEIAVLASSLRRRGIRYAYFHVRYITKTGSLEFRKPMWGEMVTKTIGMVSPGVVPVAWIYVDGSVDLANPDVRKKMVGEAEWLVGRCGFKGIQWDYEPCPSGDAGFLALLEETRSALPNAHLSVASPVWYPWPLTGLGWTEDYFHEVGKRCDQIAVMCYDTGFYTPRSYAWLVRGQADRLPKAAAPAQVILGLPTYGPGFRSHNPRAENLRIALKAVRDGSSVAGIALFADYTTDDEEWAWYDKAWRGR